MSSLISKITNFNFINHFWYKPRQYFLSSRYGEKNRSNFSRVYMFHSISNECTDTAKYRSNAKAFEKFIISEMKCREAVAVDAILTTESGAFSVTFDDVFENVYINAYPILKKYGIPFTLFIANDLLDKPGYLTNKELKELSDDPLCTIGAHTVHHVRLRTCKESYNEIQISKLLLEEKIKKEVRIFAYPYGSIYACSRRNIKEVEKAGYLLAFSAVSGIINKYSKTKTFFLPRINADHLVKAMEDGRLL